MTTPIVPYGGYGVDHLPFALRLVTFEILRAIRVAGADKHIRVEVYSHCLRGRMVCRP